MPLGPPNPPPVILSTGKDDSRAEGNAYCGVPCGCLSWIPLPISARNTFFCFKKTCTSSCLLSSEELLIMPSRTYLLIPLMLLLVALSILLSYPTRAFADQKPKITLNRQQGPLGVTLTMSGEKFTPGLAALSYIDSHNTPGIFTPPGDSSVQVQADGSFSTSNLVMPSSGPVGPWKIIVTDSTGSIWLVSYLVLAAPGQQTAGVPSLAVNPSN